MPGLKIFYSNRMEVLVEELAKVAQRHSLSPLEKETIVVQSKGMERWIRLELARLLGVCANADFSFPQKTVEEIFKRTLGNARDAAAFDPAAMRWQIMKLLPSCLGGEGFKILSDYLGEGDGLKRFQLSSLIADTFDQYSIFRPDMILEWDQGKDRQWQARLWRELARGKERSHRAALWEECLRKLSGPDADLENLPGRISIFGLSSLPPYHLKLFDALSRRLEVYFFILNPCREFWFDIVSNREMKRIKGKAPDKALPPQDLYLEQGNSLLASLGGYGRDFLAMLQELDTEEFELYHSGAGLEGNSVLSLVQSDILNLRPERESGTEKRAAQADDRSIQIHSCHSPLREAEVLHDHILSMLEEDAMLTPADILVMTPDIEAYAPFVHAVFESHGEGPSIPFSISDRSLRKESRIVDALPDILELATSRFGAIEILALLENPFLRRRFGITAKGMETVKRWVGKTRIRWGIDGDHRKGMGTSGFRENTWKAGLDRLFLGYAMEGQGDRTFMGILPFDEIEGDDAALLGNLAEFLEKLIHYAGRLKESRTLEKWAEFLADLLKDFFAEEEDSERDLSSITKALSELKDQQKISGFDETVELPVIKAWFHGRFGKDISGAGFITGKVTFAAMLPMRSIPFKAICLLGMDNNAFPRMARPHGFDLMAKNPRRGDRSLGKEDRYIFLEALLSARSRLHISYAGQNIQDNSESPPSILVGELLDYLDREFELSSKASIREHVLTMHKLQAFHPGYFKGAGPLFSYSRENFQACLCLGKKHEKDAPFISHGLSSPSEAWKTVDIRQLEKFFKNPVKFLLTKRLGIMLENETSDIREKEPFSLNGLDKYHVTAELASKGLAGREIRDLFPLAKASGALPHGIVGDLELERVGEQLEEFIPAVLQFQGSPLGPLLLDHEITGFRITGRLDNLSTEGLLSYRFTKTKPRDRLTAWVRHLALNLAAPEGCPEKSVFVGEDSVLKFIPVEDPKGILEKLLHVYWEGLCGPAPFFPKSSFAYAESILRKGWSEEKALEKAEAEWFGGEFQASPESCDPYLDLCFRRTNPLGQEFRRLALEIFGPLLEHEEEEKM
ncbi:MAG: exodeoxyribonuclease V subunit gamma [Nitrospinae bacterium]|nr:exodeoxyribonuclease V subunit gamma [Nitrospinota bacterium]